MTSSIRGYLLLVLALLFVAAAAVALAQAPSITPSPAEGAPGPAGEAENAQRSESAGGRANHGTCVSHAANEASEALDAAGADLSEDPWKRGAFVSSVAHSESKGPDCELDSFAGQAAGARSASANATVQGEERGRGKGHEKRRGGD